MPNKNQLPETIIWKAQSRNQGSRSPLWYLGFIVICAALIAFAVYNHDILTTITFAVIIIVVFILSIQPAIEKTYKLTKTGIAVGRIVYPYKIIKNFWIVFRPPEIKTLSFQTTAYIKNIITIELDKQDPLAVKLFLSQYLFEDLDHEESLTETLARSLKI